MGQDKRTPKAARKHRTHAQICVDAFAALQFRDLADFVDRLRAEPSGRAMAAALRIELDAPRLFAVASGSGQGSGSAPAQGDADPLSGSAPAGSE